MLCKRLQATARQEKHHFCLRSSRSTSRQNSVSFSAAFLCVVSLGCQSLAIPSSSRCPSGTNDDSYTRGKPEREHVFAGAYRDLYRKVRQNYGDVEIVCCLGIMTRSLCPVVERLVAKLRAAGDEHGRCRSRTPAGNPHPAPQPCAAHNPYTDFPAAY